MLAQVPRIGYLTDLPSRSALEGRKELRTDYVVRTMLCHSRQRPYLNNGYDQMQAIITDS